MSSFDPPGGAAAHGALAKSEAGPWTAGTLGPFAAVRPVAPLRNVSWQGRIASLAVPPPTAVEPLRSRIIRLSYAVPTAWGSCGMMWLLDKALSGYIKRGE